MEPTSATPPPLSARAARALRHPANWIQLAKFGVVGASGYVVNLAVYTALLHAGVHFRLAAVVSFVVSAASNYVLNRAWTFRAQRGHFAYQGVRFLVVSVVSLGANQVWLTLFVWAGAGKIVAQAISIVLVMPLNFLGNKLWSFRGH
ncbi:MAG TPA: GtrA family protein [Gaiellaceae bacterium]